MPVACPLLLIAVGAVGKPPIVPICMIWLFSQIKSVITEKSQVFACPTICPLSLFPPGPGGPPPTIPWYYWPLGLPLRLRTLSSFQLYTLGLYLTRLPGSVRGAREAETVLG